MDADFREVCKRLDARRSNTEFIDDFFAALLQINKKYLETSVAHDAQGEPVAGANTSVLHETKSQIHFPSLCTSDLNQYLKASLTNGSTA